MSGRSVTISCSFIMCNVALDYCSKCTNKTLTRASYINLYILMPRLYILPHNSRSTDTSVITEHASAKRLIKIFMSPIYERDPSSTQFLNFSFSFHLISVGFT